jgi:hypothetical protein
MTLSLSLREAVAGTVALARHACGPQATGHDASSPVLLVGRRLAVRRAREGWHDSCSVVRRRPAQGTLSRAALAGKTMVSPTWGARGV